MSAMTPPTMARTPAAGPARDDLARLLAEPAAVDDVLLERACRRRRRPTRTWAGRPGVMKPPSSPTPSVRSFVQRDLLGRAGRASRVARALRLDLGVAGRRARRRCRPSCRRARAARRRPRGTRSGRARRGRASPSSAPVATCAPSMIIAPGRGGQVGRRGRHQDRRVVEVDRVLAEPPPVEERPAGQARGRRSARRRGRGPR